jgi:hypothetical protein
MDPIIEVDARRKKRALPHLVLADEPNNARAVSKADLTGQRRSLTLIK